MVKLLVFFIEHIQQRYLQIQLEFFGWHQLLEIIRYVGIESPC